MDSNPAEKQMRLYCVYSWKRRATLTDAYMRPLLKVLKREGVINGLGSLVLKDRQDYYGYKRNVLNAFRNEEELEILMLLFVHV